MEKNKIYEILNACYFSENRDEKELLQLLPKIVQNAKTFIDVGASLGQFTYFANEAMKGVEIVSIEADPVRAEELERNCRKWSQNGNGNRIRSIHAAVSDSNGNVTFHTTNSNVSGGLSVHDISHAGAAKQSVEWKAVTVQSITIDSFFPTAPDVIKMDIEGAELQALMGAKKVLEHGTTTWLIELHEWGSPQQVLDLMRSYGYKVYEYCGRKIFSRSLITSNPSLWTAIIIPTLRTKLRNGIGKLFG